MRTYRGKPVVSFERAAKAYEDNGKSIWRAGEALGVSGQRVQQILQAAGYTLQRPRWTPRHDQVLLRYYTRYASNGRLAELATRLRRTRQFLCRQAKRLGLTDISRRKPWAEVPENLLEIFQKVHESGSDEELANIAGISVSTVERRRKRLGIKKSYAARWKFGSHPFKTAEGKLKFRELMRKAWADPSNVVNSAEFRQKLSDRAAAYMAANRHEYTTRRSKSGRRKDLGGQFFRSSWEANYARYLNFLKANGQITDWQYEPDTFWFHAIKRGTRHYTPDFKVFEIDNFYYIEVKGWMDPKSKTKLDRMARFYPNIEIRVVDSRQYKKLRAQLAAIIPDWE